MLLAGIAMLVVAATGRSRWLMLAAHVGLGVLLVLLGVVFTVTGGWFGGLVFGGLGLATVVAPALCRAPRRTRTASELVSVAIGAVFAVIGLAILTVPESLAAPAYDS